MKYLLNVNGLSKQYDNFKLDNVSFDLQPGYIMGLIGANGAGKSTIINSILNIVVKSSGIVRVCGYDLDVDEDMAKDQIGYVIDNGFFTGMRKAKYYVNLYRKTYSNWDEVKFLKYIDEFKLDIKKTMRTLSTGEKIKLQLAVALSHNAKLLILDEPSASLDPVFRKELLDILANVIKDGDKSVLISTHVTSDLDTIADYITYVEDGKVIFSITKEELNDKYKLVKGSISALQSLDNTLLIGCKKTGVGFEALTENLDKLSNKELFATEIPTIEDIMYHLYLEKEAI
jgi:ABC-2 type transport system ATP-binding protein